MISGLWIDNLSTVRKCILLFTLEVLMFSSADAAGKYDKLVKGLPKEVVEFVDRSMECNYWPGEMPSNPETVEGKERAEDVKNHLEKAKCEKLEADEKELKKKFQKDSRIIKVINESKTMTLDETAD